MTCNYENPFVQTAFVGAQTAIGTAKDTAATDGILFDVCEITPILNTRAQEQAHGGRSTKSDVNTGDGPHELTFTQEMFPSGTAGTAWDFSPFLECFWTKTDRAAIEINGTPSTTGFETTENALAVGDLIAIPVVVDSVARYEVRKVTVVVNDPAVKDTITYAPATSAAPLNTAEVAAADKFTLRACLDTDKFVTVVRPGNKITEQLSGVCPTEFTLTLAKERVDWSVKCLGKHYLRAGTTTLDAGIDNSVLAMVVDDPRLFYGITENTPVYLTIGAEGANTAEVVKATAYNSSTGSLTIVRAQKSTSASAHGTGATITPYLYGLTPTLTSQAVAGLQGDMTINGVIMEARTITLTDTEGFLARIVFGDPELTGFTSEGRREIKISAELFANTAALNAAGFGHDRTQVECWFSVGNEAGKMAFARLPQVLFTPPVITAKAGEEVVFTLDGMARDSSANDAMTFYLG